MPMNFIINYLFKRHFNWHIATHITVFFRALLATSVSLVVIFASTGTDQIFVPYLHVLHLCETPSRPAYPVVVPFSIVRAKSQTLKSVNALAIAIDRSYTM